MIIGIDMGGTHTDGVIVDKEKILKTAKRTTDRKNLLTTIWSTLQELLEGRDKEKISSINLSTTVSTNAIVENKASRVGMIVQSGPGLNHDFSSVGAQIEHIGGYSDHRGTVISEVSANEIQKIKRSFIAQKIESIGIVCKFSTRNPGHEKQISSMLEDSFDIITMGHSLSGKLNFPRRVHTAYLNSAVHEAFNTFADSFEESLKKEGIHAPVHILKADGGTISLATARRTPAETILSGPAASAMGLSALFSENQDGVLLDIGGTTTDIFFLADGAHLFEPSGTSIGGHKTLIRAIYSVSLGVGGDSHVRLEGGEIKIGPQRKGHPVAFGGSHLTPTDAMIVLDKLDAGNKEQAVLAVGQFAEKLNMTTREAANKILYEMSRSIKEKTDFLLEKINLRPVYTVHELIENKQIKPQFMNVVGGPAKILAPFLENTFGLAVHYPKLHEIANAVGAALAKPTMEINMYVDTERRVLSVPKAGIYETIDASYDLTMAESRALEIVKEGAKKLGGTADDIEAEIIESSSFNMVKGFQDISKNIRVRAQTKPGLTHRITEET